MTVMTDDGIEIFVLPDSARCILCGENPLDADECPECPDTRGREGVCYPSYCNYYTERENE